MIYPRAHLNVVYKYIFFILFLQGHSTPLLGCIIVYSTISYPWIFNLLSLFLLTLVLQWGRIKFYHFPCSYLVMQISFIKIVIFLALLWYAISYVKFYIHFGLFLDFLSYYISLSNYISSSIILCSSCINNICTTIGSHIFRIFLVILAWCSSK